MLYSNSLKLFTPYFVIYVCFTNELFIGKDDIVLIIADSEKFNWWILMKLGGM